MSFIVRTNRETGTITYHCATPSYALEKMQEFRQAEYRDIVVKNSKNLICTESALKRLAGCDQLQMRPIDHGAMELTASLA